MSSAPDDDFELEVFETAVCMAATEREAYLAQSCSSTPLLLDRVQKRLKAEAKMGNFMLTPVFFRPEPEHYFRAGDLVANRFEIAREIAEGGMAIVYEAFDRKLGRRIALKVPKLPFRGRLLQELRSALQVTHQNICRLHEIHSVGSGEHEIEFLTMEYL